jgi:hypothetical protein
VLKQVTLAEFFKGKKKGMAGVDKKGGPPKKTLLQKLANPEILLFLLTVFAMVLLGIISSMTITGVKIEKLTWKIESEGSSLNG